jgi:hypothetical protein
MSENENMNTAATAETIEAPKKRGNPNWGKKKDTIVRAGVTSESAPKDIWYVGNKDDSLHYVWARKSNDVEMNDFAHKQYVPAKGNETIMGDPFQAVKDTTGETKERGDRILMCCPKELVNAREQDRSSRYVGAKEAAQNDARKMSGKGVVVKPDVEVTTKRESLEE